MKFCTQRNILVNEVPKVLEVDKTVELMLYEIVEIILVVSGIFVATEVYEMYPIKDIWSGI